jgi:hypothetical protein
MPRTIISLSEAERDWLSRQAEAEHVPMTEIVRRALALYRRQAAEPSEASFEMLLERSRGIWSQGDGLAYQERIRSEWDAG